MCRVRMSCIDGVLYFHVCVCPARSPGVGEDDFVVVGPYQLAALLQGSHLCVHARVCVRARVCVSACVCECAFCLFVWVFLCVFLCVCSCLDVCSRVCESVSVLCEREPSTGSSWPSLSWIVPSSYPTATYGEEDSRVCM